MLCNDVHPLSTLHSNIFWPVRNLDYRCTHVHATCEHMKNNYRFKWLYQSTSELHRVPFKDSNNYRRSPRFQVLRDIFQERSYSNNIDQLVFLGARELWSSTQVLRDDMDLVCAFFHTF